MDEFATLREKEQYDELIRARETIRDLMLALSQRPSIDEQKRERLIELVDGIIDLFDLPFYNEDED